MLSLPADLEDQKNGHLQGHPALSESAASGNSTQRPAQSAKQAQEYFSTLTSVQAIGHCYVSAG
jgi:hypothetical protein